MIALLGFPFDEALSDRVDFVLVFSGKGTGESNLVLFPVGVRASRQARPLMPHLKRLAVRRDPARDLSP